MAPRGRQRKRLSRMDAAIDAMMPYGFDEVFVQKTVKQLLKEYGGDEGWAFIEEYSYKELIDAILRDQEGDDEAQTTTQQDVSPQEERAEDPALQSTTGPSGTLVDSTCNEAGNTVGEAACSELGNRVDEKAFSELESAAREPTLEEHCNNRPDVGNYDVLCPPSAEGDGNRWKDIGEDRISTKKDHGNANAVSDGDGNSGNQVQPRSKSHAVAPPPTSSPCPVNMCSGSRVQSGSNSHVSTPAPTSSPCPVGHLPPPADHNLTTLPSTTPISLQPPRRHFPCYGWISDGEEDDDFIQLPPMKPAILPQSQSSSGCTGKRKKFKSRWDIKPDDL